MSFITGRSKFSHDFIGENPQSIPAPRNVNELTTVTHDSSRDLTIWQDQVITLGEQSAPKKEDIEIVENELKYGAGEWTVPEQEISSYLTLPSTIIDSTLQNSEVSIDDKSQTFTIPGQCMDPLALPPVPEIKTENKSSEMSNRNITPEREISSYLTLPSTVIDSSEQKIEFTIDSTSQTFIILSQSKDPLALSPVPDENIKCEGSNVSNCKLTVGEFFSFESYYAFGKLFKKLHDKRWLCKLCNQVVVKFNTLRNHVHFHCPVQKDYNISCKLCQSICSSPEALRPHFTKMHDITDHQTAKLLIDQSFLIPVNNSLSENISQVATSTESNHGRDFETTISPASKIINVSTDLFPEKFSRISDITEKETCKSNFPESSNEYSTTDDTHMEISQVVASTGSSHGRVLETQISIVSKTVNVSTELFPEKLPRESGTRENETCKSNFTETSNEYSTADDTHTEISNLCKDQLTVQEFYSFFNLYIKQQKSTEMPLSCRLCNNKNFTTICGFRNHILFRCPRGKKYLVECKICSQFFSSSDGLNDHILLKHGVRNSGKLRRIIGNSILVPAEMARTKRGSRAPIPPTENLNGISAANLSQTQVITNHERFKNNTKTMTKINSETSRNADSVSCEFCKKCFSCYATLKTHENFNCPFQKRYKIVCKICGKAQTDSSTIYLHLILIHGIKNTEEARNFMVMVKLKNYARNTENKTSNMRNHKITLRQFLASSRYHVSNALYKKLSDERWLCLQCNHTVKHLHSLKIHIIFSCPSVKNYNIVCKLCTNTFATPGTLRSHIVKSHGIKILQTVKSLVDRSSLILFSNSQSENNSQVVTSTEGIHGRDSETAFTPTCTVNVSTEMFPGKISGTRAEEIYKSYFSERSNEYLTADDIHMEISNLAKDKLTVQELYSFKYQIKLQKSTALVLPCTLCNEIFRTTEGFRNHIVFHCPVGKRFLVECKICKQSFSNPGALKIHVQLKHDVRNRVTLKYITDESILVPVEIARTIDSSPSPISESDGHNNGLSEANMSQTQAEHERVKQNTETMTEINLGTSGSRRLDRCQSCKKIFSNRNSLKTHKTFHCPIKKRFKMVCKICGMERAHFSAIYLHLVRIHGIKSREEARNSVDKIIVQHQFRCKSNVSENSNENSTADNTHTKISKLCKGKLWKSIGLTLSCRLCNRMFRSTNGLRSHMLFHSSAGNKYGVECEICRQIFSSPGVLRKHVQLKHNLRNRKKLNSTTDESIIVPAENAQTKGSLEKDHNKFSEANMTSAQADKEHDKFVGNTEAMTEINTGASKSKELARCDLCKINFSSYTNLKTHEDFICPFPKKYKMVCKKCGKTFVDSNSIHVHLLCVHGIKNREVARNCVRNVEISCPVPVENAQTKVRSPQGSPVPISEAEGHNVLSAANISQTQANAELDGSKEITEINSGIIRSKDLTRCDFCNKDFSSYTNLKIHRDCNSPFPNMYEFECKACGKTFDDSNSINGHLICVHGIKNKELASKFVRNVKLEHCTGKLSCTTIPANKVSIPNSTLLNENEVSNNSAFVISAVNGKTSDTASVNISKNFVSQVNVNTNIVSQNISVENQDKVSSAICNISSTTVSTNSDHSQNDPLICNVCQKEFVSDAMLTRHLVVHLLIDSNYNC